MTRAVVYIRVSTAQQASDNKTSLSQQEADCRAYCESKGYEVRSELAWKPAQSASRLPAVMRYPHQSVGIQTN